MIPPALDAVLLERADRDPDRPLLGFTGLDRLVSYGEYATLAGRGAAVLAAHGVGRGDRVAVWAENSLAWLVLLAAAAWRGAALVALHPALTAAELADAVSRTRPRWVFHAEQVRERPAEPVVAAAADALGQLPDRSMLTGDAGLVGLPGWEDPPPVPVADPDLVLNIQFTSGSTGRPKLVGLSGRQLVGNAEWTAAAAGIGPGDRICCPLPLAHAAGLSSGAVLAVATGATWLSTRRFHPETVLDQLAAHRCTVLQAVPTMLTRLADQRERAPERWDLSALRVGFAGGAACPAPLRRRAVRALGLDRLAVVYGQTEVAPTISVDPGDGSCLPADATVGRVLPALAARVVDPATGTPVADGCEGELQVSGGSVMAGYLDDPDSTAAVLTADGWLRTGDLGSLSADRVLTLTGRAKDLIIRGGENVSPAEVEAALLAADPAVGQAYVLPVPSRDVGEEVGALLVAVPGARPDPDRVLAGAAARLARHKLPTQVRVVADLPVLANGKVDPRAALALLTGQEAPA